MFFGLRALPGGGGSLPATTVAAVTAGAPTLVEAAGRLFLFLRPTDEMVMGFDKAGFFLGLAFVLFTTAPAALSSWAGAGRVVRSMGEKSMGGGEGNGVTFASIRYVLIHAWVGKCSGKGVTFSSSHFIAVNA